MFYMLSRNSKKNMHGRVKIITTKEQKERIQNEKNKKAASFKSAMSVIVQKRSSGIFDAEGLNLSSTLLAGNPDIITVWNFRREIFLHMENELNLEEYQKLLEKDLSLTEQCLRVNPKSYGSWHHRIWILDNLPYPDWHRELMLCKRYLKLDDRNFHCWDYRKVVIEKSKVSHLTEYEFTTEMIEINFSNYSAWHFRSKLLCQLFPNLEKKIFPITETKHKEELELVENAAFTDPYDQSAWFYLQWLLGLNKPKLCFVYLEQTDQEIYIVTSRSIKMTDLSELGFKIAVKKNNVFIYGKWISVNHNPQAFAWRFQLNDKIQHSDLITVTLEENGIEYEEQQLRLGTKLMGQPNFLPSFSNNIKDTISRQLSSCNQLLELEPDSKWPLVTSIYLMLCLNSLKYENQIRTALEKLMRIDPLRKGYYLDLRNKIIIELKILKCRELMSFSLPNENLSCLYHCQYLHGFEEINLSFNNLTSESLSKLYALNNCKCLNLCNNKIKNLEGLPVLPELEVLLVEGNLIEHIDNKFLIAFPSLKKINLKSNPVAAKIDFMKTLTECLMNIQFIYLDS